MNIENNDAAGTDLNANGLDATSVFCAQMCINELLSGMLISTLSFLRYQCTNFESVVRRMFVTPLQQWG